MSDREQSIRLALESISAGRYRSIRQAALAYGLPQSTLSARYHGRAPRARTNVRNARLTRDEEDTLAQWFRDNQSNWNPLGHAEIRQLAQAMCAAKGDTRQLGNNWFPRFKNRFPGLKFGRQSTIDRDRLTALDADTANAFFSDFRAKIDSHSIDSQDTWNMDETGFQMGAPRGHFVLFDPSIGPPLAGATGVRAWVTIIETISMAGILSKPYLIQRGKAPESHWLPSDTNLPNWHFAWQQKGWTDNELGLDWLLKVFLPLTKRGDNWRMLLLDNHKSHISGEFLYECSRPEHRLVVCFIPPHSSHKLQPLDLGPFSPLSTIFKKNLALETPNGFATVTRARFIEVYNRSRAQAFTERNIRAGWTRCGLQPWNTSRILEDPTVLALERFSPRLTPPALLEGNWNTPHKPQQFLDLLAAIEEQISPIVHQAIHKIARGAIQAISTNTLLKGEVKSIRQLRAEEEKGKRSKRFTLAAAQRSLDMNEVKMQRIRIECNSHRALHHVRGPSLISSLLYKSPN